jgi:hypothetical protein
MTHDEKITYMRIATNVCRFGFEDKHVDLLVCLYEELIKKGGDMSFMDSARIEDEVKKRDDIKQRTRILDKVSEQIV